MNRGSVSKKIKKHLSLVLGILLLIAALFVMVRFVNIETADILAFSPESLIIGAFIIVGLHCLKTVVIVIPMAVLYISSGILFPLGWAFVVTCIGMFLELTLGYTIGKRLGRKRLAARLEKHEKIKRILEQKNIVGMSGCFLLRFIPIQLDLVSMFLGASGMKYPQFMLFSFLGATPGMIPFVLVGDAILTPLSREFLIPFSISAIISISGLLIYIFWQKKRDGREAA